MKYRVHLRMANGHEKKIEVDCDGVDFANSWWARFYRDGYVLRANGERVEPGEIVMMKERVTRVGSVVVAAIPGEHLTLIELVEPPA